MVRKPRVNLYDVAFVSVVDGTVKLVLLSASLVLLALTLAGCSSRADSDTGKTVLDGPDLFSGRAQQDRTRNSFPQGGSYEKSDSTPPSLSRGCD
jgi:hypothetical protein